MLALSDPALAQTGLSGVVAVVAIVLIVGALFLRRWRGGSGEG
jgi:hypothetical protein